MPRTVLYRVYNGAIEFINKKKMKYRSTATSEEKRTAKNVQKRQTPQLTKWRDLIWDEVIFGLIRKKPSDNFNGTERNKFEIRCNRKCNGIKFKSEIDMR